MKTTFRRRFSRDQSEKRRLVPVIATLVVGVLFITLFKGPIIGVVGAIWKGENAVARGVRSLGDFFRDKNAIVAENLFLKERLANYENIEASYRALEETQTEMLELFGRNGDEDFVAASVLAHPPKTPYDVLVIDIGEDYGLEVGDRVRLPLGGALGQISEVHGSEAKVLLYTASGVKTEAYLERDGSSVELIGKGGGAFELLLPRDVVVEVGDKVLMPGLTAELVGVIADVQLEATDSAKNVLVRGVGNVSNIRFVEVY